MGGVIKDKGIDKNFRQYLIVALSVGLCLFQLYGGFFGIFNAFLQRAIHLGIVLILVFLIFPFKKGTEKRITVLDLILILSVLYSLGYLFANYHYLTQLRIPVVTKLTLSQVVGGTLLIITILEAVRRVLGKGLVIVTMVFLLYYLIGPYLPRNIGYKSLPFGRFLDGQYLTTTGVFGMPLGLSATYISLFIIFGSILNKTGLGEFIINFVMGITGRSRGGPAKIAVISSALFGTISGSGTANAMTTGNFTIPLMKRIGYKPHFAAAVEAAASTGGQIMPPIMGAAAFLMAEFTGIPYIQIIKYAIVPAILYFAGIFFTVDMEAARLNLGGIKKEDMPEWKSKALSYAHMVIPLVVLLFLLIRNYTPTFSATWSIAIMVLISFLRKETRLNLKKVADAFLDSSNGIITVATACAAAGIIIGVVAITGVSVKFSSMILSLSGGNVLLALILTMIASIILGMGLPTTAAYILMASMLIPALINLNIPVASAHFFGFYFSCISLVTPPVAVTSYACAGLAGANFNKTGWTAVKLAASGFVVPFFFVYSPELLLIGSTTNILLALPSALLGVYSMSVALQGYWGKKIPLWLRGIILLGSGLLIAPGIYTDLVGLGILLLCALLIKFAIKKSLETGKTD